MAILLTSTRAHAGRSELRHERVVSLRDWLAGRWAAVFSHPEDFAPHPSTPAGFIGCLADGVAAAGVKPIVFARSLDEPLASWLDHAFNDDAVVVLDAAAGPLIDLSERKLATTLRALHQRFLVVLDEHGRCRNTLCYSLGADRQRTLLDVMDLIAELRSQGAPQRALRKRSA